MVDSVHFARWLWQFKGEKIQFKIISSSPHRRLHPTLKSLIEDPSQPSIYSINKVSRYLGLPLWVVDRLANNRLRALLVKLEIRRFKPDFVHAIELQNAGYIILKALGTHSGKVSSKLILTNYGSDLYWFGRFKSHREKLEKLLKLAHYYGAECERDVSLAKALGFAGQVLPVIPNAGGFSSPVGLNPKLSSERNTIAIKGYQNRWGRALVALSVLEKNPTLFAGYKIRIFSCDRKTIKAANRIRRATGLTIECHRKNALSHNQVGDLLANSVAYVGLSMSDGISTSMLEAMNAGAIPIQSSTACVDEWFRDGVSGFSVDPENAQQVEESLKKILEDQLGVERARKINADIISERADQVVLRPKAFAFYELLSLETQELVMEEK